MDSKNSETANSETANERFPDYLSFKRFYREIHGEEIESAINYLASNIPKAVLKEAFEKFEQNFDFVVEEHFGPGIYVRNLLRRGGFDWGDMELDCNWVYLLWEASKKVCRKKD
ncbi:MAG: hypothetical protein PHF18_07675 [Methanosarcina sp.]|uniref:hypothetical protein n=1 Tax=Methanosarcina sp. TaxID=2213 RepID=UPI002616614F|nr:hypothetical protein [Methanosarcina sp.]MDD3246712.1 hypothetical protein [Methanosarcina sp.]MDD4249188.1 hypothetical protein [Methanosarcina sp.]